MLVQERIVRHLTNEIKTDCNKLIMECVALNNECMTSIYQSRWDWCIENKNNMHEELDALHTLDTDLDPCKVHITTNTNGLQSGYADDSEMIDMYGNISTRGGYKEVWSGVELSDKDLRDILKRREGNLNITKEMEELETEEEARDIELVNKVISDFLAKINGTFEINNLGWARVLGFVTKDEFEKYLIDNKLLIMLDWHGKAHVTIAKKVVTKKNVYASMLHLRDLCVLPETSLDQLKYGSLGRHIAFLRKGHLFVANSAYESTTMVDESKMNKMILDRLCWEIASELFGCDEEESVYEMQIDKI